MQERFMVLLVPSLPFAILPAPLHCFSWVLTPRDA